MVDYIDLSDRIVAALRADQVDTANELFLSYHDRAVQVLTERGLFEEQEGQYRPTLQFYQLTKVGHDVNLALYPSEDISTLVHGAIMWAIGNGRGTERSMVDYEETPLLMAYAVGFLNGGIQ